MNKKEKNKHSISKQNQEEISVSSVPVSCYVPEAAEAAESHRVKQGLLGDGLSDRLLIFKVFEPKTKHEYKIYATGDIEGFPPGSCIVNYFLSFLIKARHRFGEEILDILTKKST